MGMYLLDFFHQRLATAATYSDSSRQSFKAVRAYYCPPDHQFIPTTNVLFSDHPSIDIDGQSESAQEFIDVLCNW